MRYLPITETEKKEMLEAISAPSIDSLFHVIPNEFYLNKLFNVEESLGEIDLERFIKKIASNNYNFNNNICLIGEINYYHMIPKIVKHLSSLPQFYTAYTPYQPEISQGTLEAIYEFQSYMTNITMMSVSNASLYDGATAAAESMYMVINNVKKDKVAISSLLHPNVKNVIRTYARSHNIEITEIASSEGSLSLLDLREKINKETACLIIQSPNVFGILEDIEPISEIAKEIDCKIIHTILEPTAFGILKPFGEDNVDVVCGEAQSFGIETSFGGPGLGFITAKKEYIRKLPGRIVGRTIDKEGRSAYVMTLRAREQDIRREKATSNICSNHALCALQSTIYLSSLGKEGLKELAIQNLKNSHYAIQQIIEKTCFKIPYRKPIFNEFLIELPISAVEFRKKMIENNILVSSTNLQKEFPFLKNPMILTFTEMITKEEIDKFVDIAKEIRK